MKSLAKALTLAVLIAQAPGFAPAQEALVSDAIPIPDPPTLAAKGHLLIEHNSGAILAENNVDERLEPASLTKILTAYVAFRELAGGNLALDEDVLISEKAWRTGGSKMFIEVGKKVSVEDLL